MYIHSNKYLRKFYALEIKWILKLLLGKKAFFRHSTFSGQYATNCSNEMLLFRKILPVHFLNKSELGREEEIMRDWLDVLVTESGLLVAQQTIERPPLMVAQMTEEWLNYYRKIAQSNTVPGTV